MSKRGRPAKYDPAFATQAEKLCNLGATDADLADFFGVATRTIERWKGEHEEFCRALKDAKEVADQRVERSLYQRAVGYQVDSVKIFMPAGAAEPVYAEFRENVQPDVTAAIFWLKNRKGDVWKDKKDVETSVGFSAQFENFIRELTQKTAPRTIEHENDVSDGVIIPLEPRPEAAE